MSYFLMDAKILSCDLPLINVKLDSLSIALLRGRVAIDTAFGD